MKNPITNQANNEELFTNDEPINGNIPDGKYKVMLTGTNFVSEFYQKKMPGVYWNPEKKQYILRFVIAEGDREGIAFPV